MKRYVTYLPNGELDGCFVQEPPATHIERLIEVDTETARLWCNYRANAARDGVELLPPAAPAPPTEAQITAPFIQAVQSHMDAAARRFGYDDLLSVISYAEEPAVERYQTEGRAFRAWRSRCWAACETVLGEFRRGKRDAPATDELIALLPTAPKQEPL